MKNEMNDDLIERAVNYIESRWKVSDIHLTNTITVYNYLKLNLGDNQNEKFAVIFLTCRNTFIAFEKIFQGSISTTVVYPRVIVEKALEHHAAKVILAHNHPSSFCKPSRDDLDITALLKNILAIIDVEVIDHVIVSNTGYFSFAENNLL